jgi:hypothetical protein
MDRRVVLFLVVFLVSAIAGQGTARAAIQRPVYTAGDRWVYDLRGSLDAFPGSNGNATGNFSLGLVGRTEVAILGMDQILIGGGVTSVVRVETRTSGFLNGTLSVPGIPGDATVSGTLSSLTTELWDAQAYLPIVSNSTVTYRATVAQIIVIEFSTTIRANATTAYTSLPPFGQSAMTAYTSVVVANTTSTFSGRTFTSENLTSLSGTWTREIVRETNVSVDAGTFATTELNQSLTAFPGLAGLTPAEGGNETAYHSNSAGNFVKREAYANGTRVAEMTLHSYSYGSRASGLSVLDLFLLIAVPIFAVLAVIVWVRRRKPKPSPPGGEARAR